MALAVGKPATTARSANATSRRGVGRKRESHMKYIGKAGATPTTVGAETHAPRVSSVLAKDGVPTPNGSANDHAGPRNGDSTPLRRFKSAWRRFGREFKTCENPATAKRRVEFSGSCERDLERCKKAQRTTADLKTASNVPMDLVAHKVQACAQEAQSNDLELALVVPARDVAA